MPKKIDPMKDPPAAMSPEDETLRRELMEITNRIQDLIVTRPHDAKKIVYGFLGHAIAYADGIGIDVDQFVRDIRTMYEKPRPL